MGLNNEIYTFTVNVKGNGDYSKYKERNKIIALNVSDYTNSVEKAIVEGLGHSARAVKLPPVKKITSKTDHLEYTVYTESTGDVRIKI